MAPHRRNVLTPVSIKSKEPGRHGDGNGLYLVVDPSGAKRWVLRTLVYGRRVDMGLGRYSPTSEKGSLAAARRTAERYRDIARSGGDPVALRRSELLEERAKDKTFREYALDYIETHKAGWKNEKHQAQWKSTLEQHVFDVFGDVQIGRVDRPLVLAALKPIWTTLPETASRVRGRIANILDAAKADGFRSGDNPADWKGSLQTSLPKQSTKDRVVHHAALPYAEIADFMAALAKQEGVAARALAFAILTATRTGEIIGATWDEVDNDGALWTIPKTRMKAKREHRVPLSRAALSIVGTQLRSDSTLQLDVVAYVFPGMREGKPLSNMSMLAVLKRMGRSDLTAHGFRSTFRDWAGEQTNYPREVCEHALAHGLADETEAAYQRGDMLRKRRALMEEWATYCITSSHRKPVSGGSQVEPPESGVTAANSTF